jgi:hypothetical protein
MDGGILDPLHLEVFLSRFVVGELLVDLLLPHAL